MVYRKKVILYGKEGGDFINDLLPITENGYRGYLLVGSTYSFNIDNSDDAWIIKTRFGLGAFDDCFTQNVAFNVQSTTMNISSLGTIDDWNITSTPNLVLNTGINMTSILLDCPVPVNEITNLIDLKSFPNPTNGFTPFRRRHRKKSALIKYLIFWGKWSNSRLFEQHKLIYTIWNQEYIPFGF